MQRTARISVAVGYCQTLPVYFCRRIWHNLYQYLAESVLIRYVLCNSPAGGYGCQCSLSIKVTVVWILCEIFSFLVKYITDATHCIPPLTHCELVTPNGQDILVITGSGNGLSPVRRQAITWTNDDLLSAVSVVTKFNVIGCKKYFSFNKMLAHGSHFVLCWICSWWRHQMEIFSA